MKNCLLVALSILFLTACSVFDKEEDLPSFVKIDEVTLETEAGTQGSDRVNIKEVQVTANNKTIGIFSLPAVVPVLENGSVELIITPIIDRDGVSTTKLPYPHYDRYRITEVLNELDTLEIFPSITYLNNLTFWVEDFTASASFESNDIDSDGELVRILTEPFEPPASGFIDLPEDGFVFYAETEENFQFPIGSPVFLEMHYSCNHPFRIGALAKIGITESARDLVGINPTTSTENKEWNKIYINLTEFVADFANASTFEIYIRMSKDSNYPDPLVFIDNVKVVYPS